jgi:hypothetical protein
MMVMMMMMMITQHRFDGARTILILQHLLCLKYLHNARTGKKERRERIDSCGLG